MTSVIVPKCGFCNGRTFLISPLHIKGWPHPQASIICKKCNAVMGIADPKSLELNPLSAENEA